MGFFLAFQANTLYMPFFGNWQSSDRVMGDLFFIPSNPGYRSFYLSKSAIALYSMCFVLAFEYFICGFLAFQANTLYVMFSFS